MRPDLEARSREITDRLRAIDEQAGDEPLADELRTEWESLTTEHAAIRERDQRLQAIAAAAGNPHAQEPGAQAGVPDVPTRTVNGSPRDDALRAIERADYLSSDAGDN